MKVEIKVSDEALGIKKVQREQKKLKLTYSEKDLLDGMNSNTAHAVELATPNLNELGIK